MVPLASPCSPSGVVTLVHVEIPVESRDGRPDLDPANRADRADDVRERDREETVCARVEGLWSVTNRTVDNRRRSSRVQTSALCSTHMTGSGEPRSGCRGGWRGGMEASQDERIMVIPRYMKSGTR